MANREFQAGLVGFNLASALFLLCQGHAGFATFNAVCALCVWARLSSPPPTNP